MSGRPAPLLRRSARRPPPFSLPARPRITLHLSRTAGSSLLCCRHRLRPPARPRPVTCTPALSFSPTPAPAGQGRGGSASDRAGPAGAISSPPPRAPPAPHSPPAGLAPPPGSAYCPTRRCATVWCLRRGRSGHRICPVARRGVALPPERAVFVGARLRRRRRYRDGPWPPERAVFVGARLRRRRRYRDGPWPPERAVFAGARLGGLGRPGKRPLRGRVPERPR